MQSTGQSTTPWSRRRMIGQILLPLLLGVLMLLQVLGDPHSQAIRGGDMMRLIGRGSYWGVAFVVLLHLIVPKFRKR